MGVRLFIILLSISMVATAFAEWEDIDINDNGYNWNSMSMSAKEVFTTLLYKRLGTDKQKYPLEDVIKKIDDYYSLARYKPANEQNGYLTAPIACVMGQITGCKIELLDEHEQVKRVLYKPKN